MFGQTKNSLAANTPRRPASSRVTGSSEYSAATASQSRGATSSLAFNAEARAKASFRVRGEAGISVSQSNAESATIRDWLSWCRIKMCESDTNDCLSSLGSARRQLPRSQVIRRFPTILSGPFACCARSKPLARTVEITPRANSPHKASTSTPRAGNPTIFPDTT
jgi:hypothetical protein